ncbi:glycerophosphodiester phosphodiesterase [Ramlibacter sp.]|uniref:glycerophosphodiester phosphodiesterase n=1 Tax=Ramlibacter sp. TaxID=1917967 RepID=UPI002635DFC4|nr:glycerophosphodiester phosphodiesterase [Ramlibacter sp.]
MAWLLLAAAPLAATARDFDLQGHRGARAVLPENSLPGFAYTLGVGVTTIETDIAITRDGVLVLSHDPALNADITRGPDGSFLTGRGPLISKLTAAELAAYDVGRIRPGSDYARTFAQQQPVDGTRIPRLADLFALARKAGNEQVRFAIETKLTPTAPNDTMPPEEFARRLVAAIREAGLEQRSSILSFDWRTLQLVQKEAPGIPTVYLSIQQRSMDNIGAGQPGGSEWTAGFQLKDHGSVPRMIKAAGGHTWSSFWRDLTPEAVKEAQALGLKVLAWTVNDAPTMARMFDMGVNGIVTDRPELLRAQMQQRGMPLPRATPVRP